MRTFILKSAKISDRMVGRKSGSTKEKSLMHMVTGTGSDLITLIRSFIKLIWQDHMESADSCGGQST